MPTSALPAGVGSAPGEEFATGGESRLATATLVAAMRSWPPPKAKPSSAESASGAASIMASAGTLRMVLRRSFQATAAMRLTAARRAFTLAEPGRSDAETRSRGWARSS